METVNIRIPERLKEKLAKLAEVEDRSLSNYLAVVLKNHVTELEEVDTDDNN